MSPKSVLQLEPGQDRCPSSPFEAPTQGGTRAQAGHVGYQVMGQEGFKSHLGHK